MFDKIIEWSKSTGLMGHETTQEKRFTKLIEEAGELGREILHGNLENAAMEIGDIQVVLAQIAYKLGFTLDDCSKMAYEKIKNRNGRIVNGTFVKR